MRKKILCRFSYCRGFLPAASIIICFLFSCKKEFSNTEVVIAAPDSGNVFFVTDTVMVLAYTTDEQLINQYKIQMILAQPSEVIDTISDSSVYFFHSYLFVSGNNYNLDSISHQVSFHPAFLPGQYRLIVSVLNDQFLEAKDTVMLRIFNITDTIAPELTLFSPLGGTFFNLLDTIDIFGLSSDIRTDLSSAPLWRWKISMHPDFPGNAVQLSNTLKPTNDTIRRKYVIPATLPTGWYTIYIDLVDEYNNFTSVSLQVNIN